MLPVRAYARLLADALVGLGRRMGLLAVGVLVGLGLRLVSPQLFRDVIDGALAGDDPSALRLLALAAVGIALVAQVVTVVSTWLAEDVGWRATNRLRSDLTAHVLAQDVDFHTHHSPGELIERVDGDVTSLSNFFSAMAIQVLGNGLLIAAITVLLAVESLLLGGLVALLVVVGLVAFGRVHGIAVPWWRDISATQAGMFGTVGELAEGTEDLVPNGATPFVQARFADQTRAYLPVVVRGWSGYSLMWGSGELLATAMKLVVVLAGGALFASGELTAGSVFLALYYVLLLDRPLHGLREQMDDLQKAGGAIRRLEELRAVVPTLPPPGDVQLPDGPLSLSLEEVSFRYAGEDDAPLVLDGVTLRLGAGRTLGVVGRTGAGKSTLGKLAVRLHDPTSGTVRLGGTPIGEVADLRSRVGVVTQDVQLFHASVRDNLTFFEDGVDDDRLRAVLDGLALGTWLERLPDGLDTVVDGDDLSAGQAQLLALGRIFLRDPGLVVLDEPSSRLDPSTEGLLDRAVARLLEGRTAVIIAHRLDTLDRVDDVLVLDGGRAVEHGPREDLAADPTSRFSRLRAAGDVELLA